MDKKDLYADYKSEKYAHYRNIPTGEFETQKVKSAKTGERLKPIMKKVKVSFDEVKTLKLDSFGTVAPTLDTEDFTIVSNYLVDFWGAIMGDSAISAYLHLKRHAYGKKDYCYIDIDLLALKMGKSVNPVKGYLKTLEEYGFVATFLRKDVTDNNRDVSPLFKLRRYVPLLTKELYDSLHPKLQKLHDEFMEDYQDITFTSELHNTDNVIENIVAEGEVINNKEMKEKIEQVYKEGKLNEYVLNTLKPEQAESNERLHELLIEKLSKPSYETWMKKTIFIMDDLSINVLAPNEFNRDWLENKYAETIKSLAVEACGFLENFGSIDFVLLNDYVTSKMSKVV